ncbi:MAG: site-specific DNA-methyltransferase [Acidimicrobiia bacterium]
MASTYSGRLELTWTNKDMRLLAHEDGRYEWVPASDYRVAETRLLHNVASVGDVGPDPTRASDNLLIRGDALYGLTCLLELPEFARNYAGKVRLCYIDPPFNTGQAFEHYDDALEHSVWLTMMRDRLLQVRRLLSENGSVWLHLDDAEVHRARCVLDEVFGAGNFIATVIWQKIHARNNSAQHFSTDHDYVLVYAKSKDAWVRNRIDRTALSDKEFWNPDDDPRGPWRRSDLTASHAYSEGKYEVTGPDGDTFKPRENRWWSVSKETFEALRADDRLWWGRTGTSFPFRKRFQSELLGLVPTTIWPHDDVGDNREAKSEITRLFGRDAMFGTPKPERFLHRVMNIASDPGDIVVDCFLGSGTTAAVAHKLGRRWVGIEWSADTVATFALPRLTKVVKGQDVGGVTEAASWSGGGGFRVLDVAPSMFEDDEGRVVLAEWATNGALCEATAAQLGFDFIEEPPFCGRKGRTRLAVVDGLVGEEAIRVLIGALGVDERAVVCGTAIDPAARAVLKELRPGSTMRKIPGSILEEYRQHRRAHSQLAQVLDWAEAVELMEPGVGIEAANAT